MTHNELSATAAVKLIAEDKLKSEDLVRACLDRIAARDTTIQAWVCTRPDMAISEARRKDKEPNRGPLHGLPIGIKDVLDTSDMPTEMGSPIYKGYQPRADAACVAALKAAGAIVLGKTVTAEFAYVAPGPTRNPHNERHTPGGSSSGSAAAVADFMVPVALGTQTGGSVIRPASFCGIFGFKPTYGAFNRSGLKLAADSLDTIGLLTRSIEDIALFKNVLTEQRPNGLSLGRMARPRIGLCRTHLWHKANRAAQIAVESAAKALSEAGAHVTDFELSAGFRDLDSARTIINNVERARAGTWEWHSHRRLLSQQMIECIESGLATRYNQYLDAIRLAERCRIELDLALQGTDALLTLSVSGEAPEGLSHTGDSTFQSLWTLLHVPSLTLPTSTGETNLPIGIQLIAPRFHDDQLLRVAEWVWTHLR